MSVHFNFNINPSIYVKDPESSELGRRIVKRGIDLIYEFGFEAFTFKKLAIDMHSTEATIYRYFESKHRLLLYIMVWYWHFIAFQLKMKLKYSSDPKSKLKEIINLLTHFNDESIGELDYNKRQLSAIINTEGSKSYLTKDVKDINNEGIFLPYKMLCQLIAEVITEYNPDYPYPKSLSSTIIEIAHFQTFFKQNLPRLTDDSELIAQEYACNFIDDLCFRTLKN